MFSKEPDFSGNSLADALRTVRRRIVVNRWLQTWVISCNWIFAVLIVLAALLHFLRMPLLAGGLAIVLAGTIAGIRAVYLRPSTYETAQKLDSEGRQEDRISTAIYFWNSRNPNAMVLHQREDALSRAAKLDAEPLFPIRVPKRTRWTAVLGAVFAALCLYHANYGPPIPELKQKIVQSRTLATLLSPLSRMLESATAAVERTKGGESQSAQERDATEAARKLPGQDASANVAKTASSLSNGKSSDATPPNGSVSPSVASRASEQGGQTTSGQTSDAQSGAKLENAAQDRTSDTTESANSASASSGNSNNKLVALAQKALQALQSLMQNALGKEATNGPSIGQSSPQSKSNKNDSNGQQGTAQATAASGQASKGASENGQGMDVTSSANHGQLSGAGNSAPAWALQANRDRINPANLQMEHVPLESNGFKGPTGKERANVGTGTAQVPLQNVAPPAVATVNGAGQDTVPPRYLQYVRDYFDQGKK